MRAIEAVTAKGETSALCQSIGVSRASLYRRRRPTPPATPRRPRAPSPRALVAAERRAVRDTLHNARFVDQSPAEVYATLLEEQTYLCSPRTMYRVLAEADEVRERRDQVRHPAYVKPELVATAPNQGWSWDITKLKGPVPYLYYSLYVILDLFSRYVVGWLVAVNESAHLAERLIEQTCAKQCIGPPQLTIHAARGAPMRSKLVALLFSDLGIAASHARPRVSNDNPFSEAQFRTFKYRRSFRSGSAHSNTRAPSATTSWLGTMTPTTTAASAISRRPTCITAARRRSSTGVIAPASRPTPRIRSDSSADHHARKPCRPPYGSIRRRKRPARMPQDRRPAPRTTRSLRSLPGGDHRSIGRRCNASMAGSRYSKC